MRYKLDLLWQTEDKIYLAWYADGEEGGFLEPGACGDVAPADRDEWEHWAASMAVKNMPGTRSDWQGFYWESSSEAKAARSAARAAIKGERQLPEWALQALSAGWKRPRGWKP